MSNKESLPEWLETISYGDFRVWHLIFFGLTCGLSLSKFILLCCLIKLRIPRTKQEIEGNYQRNKIARKFRQRLANIDNSELDEMDFRRALEYMRADFDQQQEHAKFLNDPTIRMVYNINNV